METENRRWLDCNTGPGVDDTMEVGCCWIVTGSPHPVGKSVIASVLARRLASQGRPPLVIGPPCDTASTLLTLPAQESRPSQPTTRRWATARGAGTWALHAAEYQRAARRSQLDAGGGTGCRDVVVAGRGGVDDLLFPAPVRRIVVVVTPPLRAVIEGYALTKAAVLRAPGSPIEVVVNRAASFDEGEELYETMSCAARRFLHIDLPCGGIMLEDAALARGVALPTEPAWPSAVTWASPNVERDGRQR